jgi:hypothetical protein
MQRLKWLGWAVLGTLGGLSPCGAALAQSGEAEPASAASLFSDARQMMDNGNFAEACPKLAKSQALDPQVGTMLNLALCYQSLGQTASACGWWRDAAATAAGKSQSDREEFAREQMERTCPRDAGEAGATQPSAVDMEQAPRVQPEQEPAPSPASNPTGAPKQGGHRGGLTTAAWVAGAAGVAAIGAASAFGAAAWINIDASHQQGRCVGNICNAQGLDEHDRAVRDATISDIGFAVGAGALAAGIVLWLVDRHPHMKSALYLRPEFARSSWSMTVGDAW